MLIVAPLLTPCAPARAAPQLYRLTPENTVVTFRIDYLFFGTIKGRFRVIDGELTLDPDAPENSSIAVTIAAASAQLQRTYWEGALKGKSFLYTDRYPEITFQSSRVVQLSPNLAMIPGTLKLRDAARAVTVHADLSPPRQDTAQESTLHLTAWSKIKRSTFGIRAGLPFIADQVNIAITADLKRERYRNPAATNAE